MKAFELLATAAKEPEKYEGKKYKVTAGAVVDYDGKIHFEVFLDCNGEMHTWDGCHRAYITSITELEEIKQPVPFMEAVKAYRSGKTIRCEDASANTVYALHGEYGMFQGTNSSILNVREILEGKWYIED